MLAVQTLRWARLPWRNSHDCLCAPQTRACALCQTARPQICQHVTSGLVAASLHTSGLHREFHGQLAVAHACQRQLAWGHYCLPTLTQLSCGAGWTTIWMNAILTTAHPGMSAAVQTRDRMSDLTKKISQHNHLSWTLFRQLSRPPCTHTNSYTLHICSFLASWLPIFDSQGQLKQGSPCLVSLNSPFVACYPPSPSATVGRY